jgi:predicted DNA-binding protein with PD1-like motif
MEYRRFGNEVVARLDKGEEIIAKIIEISEKENIKLGNISAIGAVNEFEIGLFDITEKKYYPNSYKGDFEIVSLIGNLSQMNGKTYIHAHMSAGDKENKMYGGHLNKAIVSATCEINIRVIEGLVDREFSKEIGLNLFKF